MGPELRKRILTPYPSWHRQPLRLNLKEMEEPLSVLQWFFDIYNLTDIRACIRQLLEDASGSDSTADHIVTCEHLEKLVEAAWMIKEQGTSIALIDEGDTSLPLPPFSKLYNNTALTIRLAFSDDGLFHLNGDADVLQAIDCKIIGNDVQIRSRDNADLFGKEVSLHCGALNEIVCTNGSIVNDAAMQTEDLRIEATGKTSIKLRLNVTHLETILDNEASALLKGSARVSGIILRSQNQFSGEDLLTTGTHVRAVAGGYAQINAKQTIEGCICNGSTLKYRGEPTTVDLVTTPDAHVEAL